MPAMLTSIASMPGDLKLSPTGWLAAALLTVMTFVVMGLMARADRK